MFYDPSSKKPRTTFSLGQLVAACVPKRVHELAEAMLFNAINVPVSEKKAEFAELKVMKASEARKISRMSWNNGSLPATKKGREDYDVVVCHNMNAFGGWYDLLFHQHDDENVWALPEYSDDPDRAIATVTRAARALIAYVFEEGGGQAHGILRAAFTDVALNSSR